MGKVRPKILVSLFQKQSQVIRVRTLCYALGNGHGHPANCHQIGSKHRRHACQYLLPPRRYSDRDAGYDYRRRPAHPGELDGPGPGRTQKLRTALSTAARVLAPDEHPSTAATIVRFDCVSLRRLLQAPAATFGMSPERRTSLCSELRYILAASTATTLTTAASAFPTPVQSLLEALPNFRQLALVDFLRFLEARNIAPNAVDADTLGAYEARCATRTLCADPAARARQAAAAWNWAHQHVADWPGELLIRADRGDRYTFPLTIYPESFQQDVDRYSEQLRGQDIEYIFSDDLLDEDKPPRRRHRPLRPASVNARRWIMQRHGRPRPRGNQAPPDHRPS